jgi:hypothetical protein
MPQSAIPPRAGPGQPAGPSLFGMTRRSLITTRTEILLPQFGRKQQSREKVPGSHGRLKRCAGANGVARCVAGRCAREDMLHGNSNGQFCIPMRPSNDGSGASSRVHVERSSERVNAEQSNEESVRPVRHHPMGPHPLALVPAAVLLEGVPRQIFQRARAR